jgi:protein-disulfide isomerase
MTNISNQTAPPEKGFKLFAPRTKAPDFNLYENQDALGLAAYLALAKALGLPEKALSEALEKHTFKPKVRSDFMGGLKAGVNGTPTFFINSRRHDAAFDFDDLVTAIDAELVQVKAPG